MLLLKTHPQRLALIAGVVLLFCSPAFYPYRVEADSAYQLKSVQQFLNGQTHTLNTLVFADPNDLSRDLQTWLFWWPPLISILLLPVLGSGMEMGVAMRLAVFLITISGSLGWLAVANRVLKSQRARWLALIPILLITITLRTASECLTFDIFAFAVQPWLYLGALKLAAGASKSSIQINRLVISLGLLCLGLGSVYWLKSSAFFASIALFLFLATTVVLASYKSRTKIVLVVVALVCFCIPVVALQLLNHHLAPGNSLVKTHTELGHSTPLYNVVLHALGGPGVTLFGIENGARHLYLYNLGIGGPSALTHDTKPFAYLGMTGTLIVVLLLLWVWRNMGHQIGILAVYTIVIPMMAFSYLMYRTGIAYPIDATRHVLAYWMFVEILAMALVDRFLSRPRSISLSLAFIAACAYFAAPTGYDVYRFLRFDVIGRAGSKYSASPNQLYVPNFSPADANSVRSSILNLLQSPEDVVVMATPYCGMETWLELPVRMFPLTTFRMPLERTYGQGASYRGTDPLRTSRALRVVLAISDTDAPSDQEACIRRILGRFPQVDKWNSVIRSPSSKVAIYFADLKPVYRLIRGQ